MFLFSPNVIAFYAYARPGNIAIGLCISGRELLGQINHNFLFITPMTVSGQAVFQANGCSLCVQKVIHKPVVAVLCSGRRSLVVVEQTLNAMECLNIIAKQLKPYMMSVFPIGNEIFQQTTLLVTKLELCWSGSRNMMRSSNYYPGHLIHRISIR